MPYASERRQTRKVEARHRAVGGLPQIWLKRFAAKAYRERKEAKVTDELGPSAEDIIRILSAYLPQSGLFVAPAIPEKKLTNVKGSCPIPDAVSVLGLIDFSLFGSAKSCLVFGCHGIYFRDNSTSPRVGGIPYSQFSGRLFKDGGSSKISMGANDSLNISGCSVPKRTIIGILEAIRKLVLRTDADGEAGVDERKRDSTECPVCGLPNTLLREDTPGKAAGLTAAGPECPICESTDTFSDGDFGGKAGGFIIGGLLGGGIGAALGAKMGGKLARPQVTCRECRHKWTLGETGERAEVEPTEEELELIAEVSAAPADQPGTRLQIILDKLMPQMPGDHWYRHPTIPPKKLANATAKYAPELTGETVLALEDITFFGSADRGFLLSVHGIHYNTGGGRGQTAWTDIKKAVSVGGFSEYWLLLILKSGDRVKLDCLNPQVGRSLEKTINWIVYLSQAHVRSEPTGALEEGN